MEDLVEPLLRANVLSIGNFFRYTIPQLIVFAEVGFDDVRWEFLLDVRLAPSVVASMDRDPLSKQLLHGGDERVLGGQIETGEGDLGRLQAPTERRGVVRLRNLDLLLVDFLLPEIVCNLSLLDTESCDLCICPADGLIAIQLGPIAVPSRRAIAWRRLVTVLQHKIRRTYKLSAALW